MGDVVIGRNTVGTTVAEVDLDTTTMSVVEIIDRARRQGAELVWAYGGPPEAAGFEPTAGYAHLHARDPEAGEPLPVVEPDAYGPLLARAYLGLWGHKWVDPTTRPPTDGSIVLCLQEDGVPVGLCRVWPDARLLDQPGVVPELRGTRRTVRLLGAACAMLGPGPVDMDTWGEAPATLAACASLGFTVTEQQQGWERRI